MDPLEINERWTPEILDLMVKALIERKHEESSAMRGEREVDYDGFVKSAGITPVPVAVK